METKTLNKIFNKYVIAGICLYFALLIGLRASMNNFNIKDCIESGIMLISAIIIFLIGKKAVIYCLIIYIASVMHLDEHSLYFSLLAFTISAFIKRKYLIPLSIVYHINLIIVFIYHQELPNINTALFYSLCLIIFLLIWYYPKIKPNKELILTEDEKAILNELIKGKQLKEIDLFSKNTLTEKLKSACNKNNLMDKNELIYLYKWECSQ